MYCLALAQRRSGVEIHCATFLSNHYHLVVTDPKGNLPILTEELNKLLGRALNCHHGRWENFWSGGDQPSYVRLDGELAVKIKVIYTLANPTAAGLVSHGGDWPGVRIFHQGEYLVKKPKFFFRRKSQGGLPDRLKLTLTPPPIGCDPRIADEDIKAAVTIREKELRNQFFAAGKKFLGAAVIKAQDIYASPRRPAPKRGMSPRVSCRDKWRRIERLFQLASFEIEHDEKRERFVAGERDIVFPAGTYRFVRHFGASCAPC